MRIKFTLAIAMILALFMVTPSCGTLDGLQGMSITTSDNLINPADINNQDVVIVPREMVPAEIRDNVKFKDKELILAPDELIKAGAPKIDPTPAANDSGWLSEVLNFGLQAGTVFFPKLALLEALFTVLSRRKKEHYADAIRAIVPIDGNINLKSAVVSVGKALGVAHSSEGSAQLFEAERTRLVSPKA
tara:strand:- start:12873 stop:13439 length:567 start_codon:yes stop_codon:yes gene_type:complete